MLAKEAEKQGFDKDPDVQLTLKKIMVQKLVQKNFQDTAGTGASEVPEAELQKYFDEHKADYYRPRKVRVAAVVWNAPSGSPDRAAKLATAKKALAKLKVEEKKNALAFSQIVTEFSEDAATKPPPATSTSRARRSSRRATRRSSPRRPSRSSRARSPA